jgi:hypothetical protein
VKADAKPAPARRIIRRDLGCTLIRGPCLVGLARTQGRSSRVEQLRQIQIGHAHRPNKAEPGAAVNRLTQRRSMPMRIWDGGVV